MRRGSLLLCAILAPFLMGASPPVRLQPSSPWVVDYAKDSCRLARKFGVGKAETKLAFESEAPGEIEMMVIGRPFETNQDQITAQFLPVRGKSFDGRVNRTVDTHQPAILWLNPPLLPEALLEKQKEEAKQRERYGQTRPPARDLMEIANEKNARSKFAEATTEVSISPAPGRQVILETGSLGAPVAKFDECDQDSLRDWGVDPAIEARIVRPVWATNPSEWLFASDYPRDLIARGAESVVAVRLLVDASGKITNCTPLSHFNEPEFNRISCVKITERARFEPAELADGTKVPSYYTRRVVFRIGR